MKPVRKVLVYAFVLALTCQQIPSGTAEPGELEYAVLEEHGKQELLAKPGANVRKFNTNRVQSSRSIKFDEATGYLTLAPGTYRLDGYSITTFGYMLNEEQQKPIRSLPGYAFLWNVDTNKIDVLGSMQDPMYALPSHVNTIMPVSKSTRYYMGHQNGADVNDLYLQRYWPEVTTSTMHVFARLVVQKLPDSSTVRP